MICAFCEQDRKLIKAHIIPQSLYELDFENGPLKFYTNSPGVFPKKSPVGVYDPSIVCLECEQKFSQYDHYAYQIFIKNDPPHLPIQKDGKVGGYIVNQYDYSLLKLFFISLLWRASVTTQDFFKRINVKSYEMRLKEMINNNDPGVPDEFSVVLAKFMDDLPHPLLDPHPEEWYGVNYQRFYFSDWVAYIKTDSKPVPLLFKSGQMQPHQPLYIIARDMRKSPEWRILKSITGSDRKTS